MRGLAALGLGIIALAVPAGAQAQSVADFYKGKNVTVIVGYTAGAGDVLDDEVRVAGEVFAHVTGKRTGVES